MLITGKLLKENRESQQLSISEVAMSTKINSAMLKAIEEGQLEKLPAKTFLRGFVQAYASYLKLDVDEVMNMFYEEMGSTTPEIEIEETNERIKIPLKALQLLTKILKETSQGRPV